MSTIVQGFNRRAVLVVLAAALLVVSAFALPSTAQADSSAVAVSSQRSDPSINAVPPGCSAHVSVAKMRMQEKYTGAANVSCDSRRIFIVTLMLVGPYPGDNIAVATDHCTTSCAMITKYLTKTGSSRESWCARLEVNFGTTDPHVVWSCRTV